MKYPFPNALLGARVASFVVVSLVCLMGGLPARSEPAPRSDPVRCENAANVTVLSRSAADAMMACAGAAEAIGFLASLGLLTTDPIELRIVDELPPSTTSSASGCYLARERCAYLLPFAKLQGSRTPLELPLDRALYQSMAAHETAHVIAGANFAIPHPRIEAQEYIAYVTMFATIPASHRDRLLATIPGRGFETEAQINTTIYLFDPLRFGAQSYRHFLRTVNGAAFVQKILAGHALIAGDGT